VDTTAKLLRVEAPTHQAPACPRFGRSAWLLLALGRKHRAFALWGAGCLLDALADRPLDLGASCLVDWLGKGMEARAPRIES